MAYAADTSFLSRRGLVFLVIVAVHVGLWYVLDSGLSHKVVQKVFGPLETAMIDEPQAAEEEPPPPPPKIETPPPFVPPPEVAIQIPTEAAPATAITSVTQQRPVATPPPVAAPPKPVAVKPKMDPRRPPTRPEYPPQSLRLGESGTVTMDLYVLANGRVGDARVAVSSGFPRLDEAALREAKRSWRLTPGTENGKPAPMWHQFKMTFNIEDAR